MINPTIRHRKECTSWSGMKQRCYNPKSPRYDCYGARGIGVCGRWLNSFENFYEDMGERPSPLHSLDRINNDGNYEPGNCKWSTSKEQSANKRYKLPRTGIRGVYKYGLGWKAEFQVNGRKFTTMTYDSADKAAEMRKFILGEAKKYDGDWTTYDNKAQ